MVTQRSAKLVSLHVLSEHERQVLELLTRGITNKEIGIQLELNPKTIAGHRERIMGKLDLHSGTALVRYAITTGWIDAEVIGQLSAFPFQSFVRPECLGDRLNRMLLNVREYRGFCIFFGGVIIFHDDDMSVSADERRMPGTLLNIVDIVKLHYQRLDFTNFGSVPAQEQNSLSLGQDKDFVGGHMALQPADAVTLRFPRMTEGSHTPLPKGHQRLITFPGKLPDFDRFAFQDASINKAHFTIHGWIIARLSPRQT